MEAKLKLDLPYLQTKYNYIRNRTLLDPVYGEGSKIRIGT